MQRWLVSVLAAALLAPVLARADDFMVGADVSMLAEVERHGGHFARADGSAADPLLVLQEAGVNWVRLRLWHTPVFAADVVENGHVVVKKGAPVGGGNNDLAATMRLARRAKALGQKVLLDFHYSDFWADPATQTKPAAWTDLHGAALQAAVREYTAGVLDALDAVGGSPDMVQIGNETNAGMLWPDGQTWSADKSAQIGGDVAFAALLRAGIEGVRANDARNHRHLSVMLHLAGGTDPDLCHHMFDLFAAEHLDYDVIGLSYYSYYHGPLAALKSNLDELAGRYRKPLIVVETAYGWTTDNGDDTTNLFNAEQAAKVGWPATVTGQARAIRAVIDTVAAVPLGLGRGVFYWEPAWIPAKGAGWRTGDGNNWDNQALFDFSGRALASMQALHAPATH
ncbi:MAG: glycosyl hydrolase 53 family protein [Burkholderiaceae bacterium]|jgi:arabinogalactan endo-1,4-beta-galactosidase